MFFGKGNCLTAMQKDKTKLSKKHRNEKKIEINVKILNKYIYFYLLRVFLKEH